MQTIKITPCLVMKDGRVIKGIHFADQRHAGDPVVASGGAGTLEHFYDAAFNGGAKILRAASVFHYRTLSIRQVKESLRDKGVPIIL